MSILIRSGSEEEGWDFSIVQASRGKIVCVPPNFAFFFPLCHLWSIVDCRRSRTLRNAVHAVNAFGSSQACHRECQRVAGTAIAPPQPYSRHVAHRYSARPYPLFVKDGMKKSFRSGSSLVSGKINGHIILLRWERNS